MSGRVTVKDGDFVVTVDHSRIDVHKVTKVTAQLVFYQPDWRSRQSRVRIADVVFSGPEGIARRLREQLLSSDAQETRDRHNAADRRRERDSKFIGDAAIAKTAGAVA